MLDAAPVKPKTMKMRLLTLVEFVVAYLFLANAHGVLNPLNHLNIQHTLEQAAIFVMLLQHLIGIAVDILLGQIVHAVGSKLSASVVFCKRLNLLFLNFYAMFLGYTIGYQTPTQILLKSGVLLLEFLA